MRAAALILALWAGQATAEVNVTAIAAQRPAKLLSGYGFFDDLAAGSPARGVVPYHLASALFSDYAEKDRFIFSPGPARYQTDEVLAFPVGAAIIKTFRYGDHKVETRVLLLQEAGWKAYPYVWNQAGSDAELRLAGADLSLETDHGTLAYHVPNVNQCKACHINADKAFVPIGPKVRNLNVGDQLAVLVAAGLLSEAPDDAPALPDYQDTTQDLTLRARAYLDINCAHCHAPGHPADTSGLFLNWEEDRPEHLGLLKRPVAAGRGSGTMLYDVVPGDPDASILLFRMVSTDPGLQMPEIGRSMAHAEGVALIRDWIASLKP